MVNENQTTDNRIALIKSHALHTLKFKPEDVTSHDRLFLIAEIEWMKARITELEELNYKMQTNLHAIPMDLGGWKL